MRIAIWGGGTPVLDIIPILKSFNIRIMYVKTDGNKCMTDEFVTFLKRENIICYTDTCPDMQLDMIFVTNYNKIIKADILSKYLVVNHHVGLLPKWRGNSANAWGVINGENYVGYTIHKVTELLDGGPIYYQYKYPYKLQSSYYDAKIAMKNDLMTILPSLLFKIVANPNDYLIFDEKEFVYCSKLNPTDGIINNWNITTEELIRRFYVFSPPLGTGLKFVFKNETYEICSLSKITHFAKSTGIPGGIVYKHNNSIWVKTKDTAISLDEIKHNGKTISVDPLFVIGQRL